ncbi:hypothetical protein ABB37_05994 [Leptomonas pyrrhocoris]|uniref:Cytochrome b5 heme-binding domain-containing protein n=1 Tax=Leptomonas pyrrhocoris TaxID=157538 RepID=A0A0M9FYV0_LEPPY|nr:hypothetical protein ABB37_05994 [Leptomonas pyrrhocoris]KPA78930.1 hypothetical protein ABB37_05994 [Leptomonas pyrrhocoris]|eukprot:XP_015657369.1 hypothetical protein ABB37_05994 [Leptomonas pyrrhocoris]
MSGSERFRFFYKGKAYLIPRDYIDDEHPGGGDEIWPWVNQDMTDAFDDADHSLDALEMLEEYLDEDYDPTEDAVAAVTEEGSSDAVEQPAGAEAASSAAAAAAAVVAPPSGKENPPLVEPIAAAAPVAVSPAVKADGKTFAVPVVVSTAVAVAVVVASVAVGLSKVRRRR